MKTRRNIAAGITALVLVAGVVPDSGIGGAAPASAAEATDSGSVSYETKRDIIAPAVGIIAAGGMVGSLVYWAMQRGIIPQPAPIGVAEGLIGVGRG